MRPTTLGKPTSRSHLVDPLIQETREDAAALRALVKEGRTEAALKLIDRQARRLTVGLRRLADFDSLRDEALASMPLDDRLAALIEGTRTLLDSKVAALLLLDEDGSDLWPHVTSGFRTSAAIRPLPVNGKIHQVIEDGKPVVLDELATNEAFEKRLRKEKVESTVVVPVPIGERIGGVLLCGHPQKGTYGPKDAELLGLVAARIGSEFDLRRHMEAEVKGREDAEEQTRFRTTLLHMATHDLKTPLTAIGMQLHLLTEGTGSEAQRRKSAAMIQRNVKRLERMLDDFLDLARIEADRLTLHPAGFVVGDLLRECCDVFEAQAAQRGVTLHVDAAPDLQAYGDKARVAQVLANLVSNAIRYSDKGKVTVRAGREKDRLIVRIEDEGRGLTAEEIAGLFRPFAQVDAGRTGTGLGLYLSKCIMDAHGGRIWLESRGHGHGTTAVIELPVPKP